MNEQSSPLHEEKKEALPWNYCKACGSPPKEHEMRNFNRILRYADIYCTRCGAYVRDWDPN